MNSYYIAIIIYSINVLNHKRFQLDFQRIRTMNISTATLPL